LLKDELNNFADAQEDLKRLEKYKNSSLSCETLSDSDIFSA
jgi:ArsR family transcriptional regulator